MQTLVPATEQQLADIWYDGYGEYLMENADADYAVISNGDTLLKYMEQGYLWDEFLASRGLIESN